MVRPGRSMIFGPRTVSKLHHDLEKRIAAHVPIGLHLIHQFFKRQILVGIGV